MNTMLINPYHKNISFKNFPDLDSALDSHYDRLYDTVVDYEITPRYVYETGIKIGFRDIFYYIDRLYDNDPESIIDVGCGECIWKKWFPRIIGFDPNINEFSQQDFVDYFDEDFSQGHTRTYDCGMALNSLHFIHWDQIPQQINLAMNIVKDRFLFTFNFNMMKHESEKSFDQLVDNFNNILESLDYNITLLDYPHLRDIPLYKINQWRYVNGHVRFILSHKS